MSHPKTSKRHLTDIDLSLRHTDWLYDLAEDCDIEPAEPSVCDACAAYVMAQEKSQKSTESAHEDILRVVAEFSPSNSDVLKYWIRLGRNAAALNPMQDGMSEWAQGWNAAVSQMRV